MDGAQERWGGVGIGVFHIPLICGLNIPHPFLLDQNIPLIFPEDVSYLVDILPNIPYPETLLKAEVHISVTFPATLNLFIINLCLAVFCKFSDDFWAFWERDSRRIGQIEEHMK